MALMSSSSRSLPDIRRLVEGTNYAHAGSIKATCNEFSRWLRANRDVNRDGFLECYFPLMSAVFGINDGQGMLYHAVQRPFEADTLLTVLRPEGTLFSTLLDIDAEGLHRCRLPTSHLARHTQALLRTPAGVRELHSWPQYQSALSSLVATLDASKPSSPFEAGTDTPLPPMYILLPLSVAFLVFMALACLTTTSEPTVTRSGAPLSAVFSSSHSPSLLAYATHCLPHGKATHSSGQAPHLQLLSEYLKALLPQGRSESRHNGTLGGPLLAVLLENLLADPDMPVPTGSAGVSQAAAGGGSKSGFVAIDGAHAAVGGGSKPHFVPPVVLQTNCIKVHASHLFVQLVAPSRSGSSSSSRAPVEVKPAQREELWLPPAAITVLASHLFVQRISPSRSASTSSSKATVMIKPAQVEEPWLPSAAIAVSSTVAGYPFHAPVHAWNPKLGLARILGGSGTPEVQNVSAHIYRYLLRSVVMWPAGQAKESLAAVLDLWLAMCLPWQVHNPAGRFSREWESHVLAHIPFYILLFPAVLDLLLSTASVSPRHAYQHLNQIASAFGPEKDLMDLLRGVEQAISRTKSHRPLLHNITEGGVDLTVLVPMLLQQAEMVERAARAGLPPDNKGEGGAGPPDFKMFAQEENNVNGAAARTGAPSIAVDLLNMLHGAISSDKIDSLRSKLGFLELDRFRPSSHHDHPDLQYSPQSRSVQWGGPSGLSPEQVPYVGEFLFRPAGTNEVRMAVKTLSTWSRFANAALGLYDDQATLRSRPKWQRVLVARMHEKGWSIDLRRWAQFDSLVWMGAVSCVWIAVGRCLFGSFFAAIMSLPLLCTVSLVVSVADLLRHH